MSIISKGEALLSETRGMNDAQIKAYCDKLNGADASLFLEAYNRRGYAQRSPATGNNGVPNNGLPTNGQGIAERAFDVRPFADVVAEGAAMPLIPQIAGQLLFAGDLGFLFGKANAGKTPLAFLIAEQFCTGKTILAPLQCNAMRGNALVVDFELSMRQQGNRYRSENGTAYQFCKEPGSTLYRAEWKGIGAARKDFTTYIVDRITNAALENKCALVIVDNLSALRAQGEKSYEAAGLVMLLKQRLCVEHGITVLVIAHPPKIAPTSPITIDSMAGSAAYGNLADSVFSIMPSCQGPYIKRIQQHKSRNSADCSVVFDSQHNLIVESSQRPDGLITFAYKGIEPERDHLPTLADTDENAAKIVAMKAENPNLTHRQIAERLGNTSHTNVGTVLRNASGKSGKSGKSFPSFPSFPSFQRRSNESDEPTPGDVDFCGEPMRIPGLDDTPNPFDVVDTFDTQRRQYGSLGVN